MTKQSFDLGRFKVTGYLDFDGDMTLDIEDVRGCPVFEVDEDLSDGTNVCRTRFTTVELGLEKETNG